MPTAICKGCNRWTNSTTSNYWFTKDHVPTKCWVAWPIVPLSLILLTKPEKGCIYDQLPDGCFEKESADSLIEGRRFNSKNVKTKKIGGV
jgi:hypothetical protein